MHIRTSMAAVMFSTVFFAYPAHAQYAGPSVVAAVTVEEILNRPVDDQEIQIQGYILRQVGPKNYIFSDGTAEIMTEIKSKRFEGLPKIDDKTKVEISGEVDKSIYRAPEIEVDAIRIVQ